MSGTLTRHVRNAGGIALVSVGALGLVLPIIPGVPLLAAGVAVLGRDHPLVRSGYRWFSRSRDLAMRLVGGATRRV